MSAKLNKSELDFYFNEFAKELRKTYGKNIEAEIIVVGGAAILANYSFRAMTEDIDAIIRTNARIKDVIYKVADKYSLSNEWLNSDFTSTESFSPRLVEVSKFYKSFNRSTLSVRIVDAEYLIAMKLRSFRMYKKDLSDVVGLIMEHKNKGNPLSEETIVRAYEKLYNCGLPDKQSEFLKGVLASDNLEKLYSENVSIEDSNKECLITFEKKYPKALNEKNLEDVLANFGREPEVTEPTDDTEDYDI